MSAIFRFLGRGTAQVPDNSLFLMEVDDGAVLEITQRYGIVEVLVGYCRFAVADRWCVYCHRPFRRASDPGLTRYWADVISKGLYLHRGVRFHIVAEEEWMARSK